MPSQSHRRLILLCILTTLVAGLSLCVPAGAATASSGSPAVKTTVYPQNDPPVASDFSIAVTVGSSATGTVSSHIVEPENETMTFFANSATKGNLTVDEITGEFTYTPFATAFGTDSFTYYAYDPQQNKSNDATVIVDINRKPTAANQSITVTIGKVFNGQLLGTDADGDVLSYIIAGQPTKGFVTLNASGAFTYVPNSGVAGTDSFSYMVNDGKDVSNLATVAVTIQQTNLPDQTANRAPSANNLDITTMATVAFNGQLLGTDLDGDALTYVIVSQPSKGSLTLGATGTFVYVPNAATGSDSFTYKVSDGHLESNIAVVNITLTVPTGAPGSYFRLQVDGFAASSVLAITVNGHRVGSVKSNANGVAVFLLYFSENAAPGPYTIVVAGNAPSLSIATAARSVQIIIMLDTSAPKLANPGGLPVLRSQPLLYLPLMMGQ